MGLGHRDVAQLDLIRRVGQREHDPQVVAVVGDDDVHHPVVDRRLELGVGILGEVKQRDHSSPLRAGGDLLDLHSRAHTIGSEEPMCSLFEASRRSTGSCLSM